MNAAVASPTREPPTRIVHEPLIETLRKETVISKCMQLGGTVAAATLPRQETIDVDHLS